MKRLGRLPGLGGPIARLWNTYEHVRFVSAVRLNLRAADVTAEIDPFRLLRIPPDDITWTEAERFDFISATGSVRGGTWDRNPERMRTYLVYRNFEQRFRDGLPWERTDYYERVAGKIHSGESTRYATVGELEAKLRTYDRLYEAFRDGNYRLQSELVAEGEPSPPGDGGRALFPSRTDRSLVRHEIAVNVGREGQSIINDGRHRACLALLAGLEAVPVRVVVRHEQWQALRDRVATSVDDALEQGVPPKHVRGHVAELLTDDLANVPSGLDHPDVDVILRRRLPHREG